MNLSAKIRALHVKGYSREKIATKTGAEPDYVRRVLNRGKRDGKGVADKVRSLAFKLRYHHSLPDDQLKAERNIAQTVGCTLQEVRQALSPPKPMGRPPKPRCVTCGQVITERAAKALADKLAKRGWQAVVGHLGGRGAMTDNISDERKALLLDEYDGWRNGYDGYPLELGELLCKLNTTDEETAWLMREVGAQ